MKRSDADREVEQIRDELLALQTRSKAGIFGASLIVIGILATIFGFSNAPTPSAIVHPIAQAIGLALLPSGVVSIVYELAMRDTFIRQMRNQLSISLANHFENIDRLQRSGLADINDSLPSTRVSDLCRRAKHISIYQTWIPDLLPLLPSLKEAAHNGASVRILILAPEAPVAVLRSRDLGYDDVGITAANIKMNLVELKKHINDKFQVRLYNSIPNVSLYWIDSTIFMGMFWKGIPAVQSPQLELQVNDSRLMKTVMGQFEAVWEEGTPYQAPSAGGSKDGKNRGARSRSTGPRK